MKKNIISKLLLPLSLVLILTGCGEPVQIYYGEGNGVKDSDVELIDPEMDETVYEIASRRNIYVATTMQGVVVPQTKTYFFEKNVTNLEYKVLPGQNVSVGDIIAAPNLDSINEQIANLEEKIEQNDEAMKEKLEGLFEQMDRHTEDYYYSLLEAFLENNPEPETLPELNSWTATKHTLEGNYIVLKQKNDTIQLQIDQATELFELDKKQNLKSLEQLKESRESNLIVSDMDGVVCGVLFDSSNTTLAFASGVSARKNAVEVADNSLKRLRTRYVKPSEFYDMKEAYAFINGKKYNLTIEVNKNDEASAYSYFVIEDENDEVKMGDYAFLVMIADEAKDVIALRSTTIYTDLSGDYVYVLDENESPNKVYVTLGVTDGIYTEIVKGIPENSKVSCSTFEDVGSNTAVTIKGDAYTEVTEQGVVGYGVMNYQNFDIPYGTAHFSKMLVEAKAHVEVGTPIMEVYVEGDDLALKTLDLEIQRLEEKYSDYRDTIKNWDELSKTETKQIESYEKQISDKKETRQKMVDCYNTKVICSEYAGVVTALNRFSKDDVLSNGKSFMVVSPEDSIYIAVAFIRRNWNGEYSVKTQTMYYGNEVDISVTGLPGSLKGEIVSLGTNQSLDLVENRFLYLKMDEDDIRNIVAKGRAAGWTSEIQANITTRNQEMHNVVLVPKKAVVKTADSSYVYVLKEDGTKVATSVVLGEGFGDNYWVIDGLEEGMTVCLK